MTLRDSLTRIISMLSACCAGIMIAHFVLGVFGLWEPRKVAFQSAAILFGLLVLLFFAFAAVRPQDYKP